MKRWIALMALLSFVIIGGESSGTEINVPVVDIKVSPPAIPAKIPLNVAILMPEQKEDSAFTDKCKRVSAAAAQFSYGFARAGQKFGEDFVFPLGQILGRASLAVFPYVFEKVVPVEGEPYPVDISAIVIPTIEGFGCEISGKDWNGTISIKVVLTDMKGLPLWEGKVDTSKVKNKLPKEFKLEEERKILGSVVTEAVMKALSDAAVKMSRARAIHSYAASRDKAETTITASRPSPGPVGPLPSTTKVWLLSVGISKYKDQSLNLQFAERDARAIYQLLTAPAGGLVRGEDHAKLLLNEQATRRNMVDFLNHMCKQAFDEDLIILYFAMHGMVDPDGSELFFVASDTEPQSLASTGVSQLEIERAISKSKAGKVLMIVDTCHSGSAGLSGVFAKRSVSTAAVSSQLLNKIAIVKKGLSIFSASSSTEFSQENQTWGGGHGVFTHYLVEGLKGAADENKDKFITLRELYDYTYRRVKEDTKSNQHPEIKGTLDSNIPLAEVR